MSEWYVKKNKVGYELRDNNNGIVASSPDENNGKKLRLIAACVNACAGIDPAGIKPLIETLITISHGGWEEGSYRRMAKAALAAVQGEGR